MQARVDYTTFTHVYSLALRHIEGDGDKEFLKIKIRDASGLISGYTQRVFVPYRATRRYDAVGDHIKSFTLNTGEDLLELLSVTNGDGNPIPVSGCVLRPSNASPKWRIELKHSAGVAWTYSDDYQEAISVEGIWGYHEDWAGAWSDTGEVTPGNFSASTTTFTSADVNGYDEDGRERFEIGAYLRIEDEYLKVVDRNETSNVVTLRRGQLGTTAAAHASKAIYRYRQMPDIEEACARLAIYLYQRRDTTTGSINFLDTSVVVRDDSLRDIFGSLNVYKAKQIISIR